MWTFVLWVFTIAVCAYSFYHLGYNNGRVESKEGTPSASHNKQSNQCLCETSDTGTKNVFYLYVSSRCPKHRKLRS